MFATIPGILSVSLLIPSVAHSRPISLTCVQVKESTQETWHHHPAPKAHGKIPEITFFPSVNRVLFGRTNLEGPSFPKASVYKFLPAPAETRGTHGAFIFRTDKSLSFLSFPKVRRGTLDGIEGEYLMANLYEEQNVDLFVCPTDLELEWKE